MAIKMDYDLKIKYSLGRENPKKIYGGILSEQQLDELDQDIERAFVVKGAYFKIDQFVGTKESIDLKLGIYVNDKKENVIAYKEYTFVPNLESSDNFLKQGYEYLKMLDEYKFAVDC